MKKIVLLSLFVLSSHLFAGEAQLDPTHSMVGFEVKNLLISKVRGSFEAYEAKVTFDGAGKLSALEGIVQIDSVDTRNKKRDAHLKNEDFFDSEKYPEMKFVLTEYKGNAKKGKAIGDLTIRNVTKEVTLKAELSPTAKDHYGNTKKAVMLSGEINRKDFGVGKSFAAKSISDVVKLDIVLQLVIAK